MGAYDNPQPIKLKIDAAAQAINNFNKVMSANSANLRKQAQIKKAKLEKLNKEKEAREGRALKDFDAVSASILGASKDIDLGDKDGLTGRGTVFQQDSIAENLQHMREEFLSEIRATDSQAEISKIQAKFFNQVSIFKADVDNFAAGFRAYQDIKDLDPKEADAALKDASFEFSEMIPIYDAISKGMESGKGSNVGIVPRVDKNGKALPGFMIAQFEQDPTTNQYSLDATSTPVNLTAYREYAQKDKNNPNFFPQVKEFTPEGGSNAFVQRMINDFPGGYQYTDASGATQKIDFFTQSVQKKFQVDNRPGSTTYGDRIPVYKTNPKTGEDSKVQQTENVTLLNPKGFVEMLKTPYGQELIAESLGGDSPREVFAYLSPGAVYSDDAFTKAIAKQLESGYSVVPK